MNLCFFATLKLFKFFNREKSLYTIITILQTNIIVGNLFLLNIIYQGIIFFLKKQVNRYLYVWINNNNSPIKNFSTYYTTMFK